jgi:hypothetical protein
MSNGQERRHAEHARPYLSTAAMKGRFGVGRGADRPPTEAKPCDLDTHGGKQSRIETVTFRSGNSASPEYRVRSHEIVEQPQCWTICENGENSGGPGRPAAATVLAKNAPVIRWRRAEGGLFSWR